MTLQIWNHHKCASKFMCKLLKRIADANHLRYKMDHNGDLDLDAARENADILHIKNSHVGLLSDREAQGVHIIRNPFSVVVSAYFSHLKTHDVDLKGEGRWVKLNQQRDRLETLNKREGLIATIDFLMDPEFYPATLGPLHALINWPYEDKRFVTLRMEDFVKAPVTQIMASAKESGYDCRSLKTLPKDARFTFEKISGGRTVGAEDENSHLRSGDSQNWRKHLNAEHIALIRKLCGPGMGQFYPSLN